MRKLSKREKRLMYVALVLLVVYVGHVVSGMAVKRSYEETRQRYYEIQRENIALENRLNSAGVLMKEYGEKQKAVKERMEEAGAVFTDTGLEQYLLDCLEEAGLRPVKTQISSFKVDEKLEVLTGGIEVEAEGSREAFVKVLDEMEEHPSLYVETCDLYPAEETDGEQWHIKFKITCLLPVSWEEAGALIQEETQESDGDGGAVHEE